MSALIDTDIAIHLIDRDETALERFARLEAVPAISVITLVELEGGMSRRPEAAALQRQRIEGLRQNLRTLDFDAACVSAYGSIIAAAGFSRRKVVDRMIAATALVHGLRLITANDRDFRDIEDIAIETWPIGDPR